MSSSDLMLDKGLSGSMRRRMVCFPCLNRSVQSVGLGSFLSLEAKLVDYDFEKR